MSETKQLECTNCGGKIRAGNSERGRHLFCPYCGTPGLREVSAWLPQDSGGEGDDRGADDDGDEEEDSDTDAEGDDQDGDPDGADDDDEGEEEPEEDRRYSRGRRLGVGRFRRT